MPLTVLLSSSAFTSVGAYTPFAVGVRVGLLTGPLHPITAQSNKIALIMEMYFFTLLLAVWISAG